MEDYTADRCEPNIILMINLTVSVNLLLRDGHMSTIDRDEERRGPKYITITCDDLVNMMSRHIFPAPSLSYLRLFT